jgi:hypothetical protein
MRRQRTINRADAEEMAVKALTFLAGDGERLARFLALTGLGPDTLRAAAGSPGFLAAVLDHVVADEALLTGLAEALGERPEAIVEARRALAPAEPPD